MEAVERTMNNRRDRDACRGKKHEPGKKRIDTGKQFPEFCAGASTGPIPPNSIAEFRKASVHVRRSNRT